MKKNKTRSHIENGQAYYKHVGRYNEVGKVVTGTVFPLEDDSVELSQKKLAISGPNSAAAITTKKVLQELKKQGISL